MNLLSFRLFAFFCLFYLPFLNAQSPESLITGIEQPVSREKVYVHLDKPYYMAGEDIWFKAYLVDAASLQVGTQSKLVHVELIAPDKSIEMQHILKIDGAGAAGNFELPTHLNAGTYLIRAYTHYMRNFDPEFFFRKAIYIGDFKTKDKKETAKTESLKPDLQFFAEGGNFIAGVPNRIGFKALNPDGEGMDLNGEIFDENGNKIVDFKTEIFGMGRVLLHPEKGKHYKAIVHLSGKIYEYSLPEVQDKGVNILVGEADRAFQVIVQSTLESGVDGLEILATQKGKLMGHADFKGTDSTSVIAIPKQVFKEGVVAFTVVDRDGNALCERLAFYQDEAKHSEVKAELFKKEYGKKEPVLLELSLDKSLSANVSLAVTDMSVVKHDRYGLDIRSYLLLDSELKGTIEHPGYYFLSDNPSRREHLDILMMTQGWRRYLYARQPRSDSLKFTPETGIRFTGKVWLKQGHQPIPEEIDLIFRNKAGSFADTVQTQNQGYFELGDYNIVDNTTIVIKAADPKYRKKPKKQKKNFAKKFEVELLPYQSPEVRFDFDKHRFNIPENFKEYANISYKNLSEEKRILLKETEVGPVSPENKVGYRKKKKDMGVKHTEASHVIGKDLMGPSANGNLMQYLESRIPGLKIKGEEITLRGRTTILKSTDTKEPEKPLFLLDNMEVDFEKIRNMRVEEIDFVEVLKGSKAAVYGGEAGRGVIAIYTKSGTGDYGVTESDSGGTYHDKNEVKRFVNPGFYTPKEFYSPKYSGKNTGEKDHRTTIFWDPDIVVKNKDRVMVMFYTADKTTQYRVDIQGITREGVPVVTETIVNVK